MPRVRLPNRRPTLTEVLEAGGQAFTCSVGFNSSGQPAEVFLAAAKSGSALDALLGDIAVVISVALQSGISAEALVHSVGRLPAGAVTPGDLDNGASERQPASPLGAVLDLLQGLET